MLRILQNRLASAGCVTRCGGLLSTTTSSSPFSTDSAADQDIEQPRGRGERCINKVQLMGRVGKKPELRGSEDNPMCTFSLCTSSYFTKAATGERFMSKDWHRIAVFNPAMRDFVTSVVDKGDRVLVEGPLKYSRYTNADGNAILVTSVNAHELILLQKAYGGGESQRDGGGEEEEEDRNL